jgi:hypothetical protein
MSEKRYLIEIFFHRRSTWLVTKNAKLKGIGLITQTSNSLFLHFVVRKIHPFAENTGSKILKLLFFEQNKPHINPIQ